MNTTQHNHADTESEVLPGGGHTSFILRRGQVLRITDTTGGAHASLTMLNDAEKSHRLNPPDTPKAQHTPKLNNGHCPYPQMGRALRAIAAATRCRHRSFGRAPSLA